MALHGQISLEQDTGATCIGSYKNLFLVNSLTTTNYRTDFWFTGINHLNILDRLNACSLCPHTHL